MKFPKIKVNIVPLIKWLIKKMLRRKSHNFGWKPDKWDERDIYYKARRPVSNLPLSTGMENISEFHYRYDQGNIGSCVGNGSVAGFRRILQVNKQTDFDASRLFSYYIARADNEKGNDSGAMIRDSFKAINKYGLCSEQLWPYITTRFADKPPDIAFKEAQDHQSIRYERIYPPSEDYIKDALYHHYCVVFGIVLHNSFMSDEVARTGIVPDPKCWDTEVGGHCLVCFDYTEEGVWVLNSWGKSWGIAGICFITWKNLLKFGSDFWIFYTIEG